MIPSSSYLGFRNNVLRQQVGFQYSPHTSVNGYFTPISTFSSSDKVELPFRVSGRLVSPGDYDTEKMGVVTLPAEELKRTLNEWVGIEIYSSHEVYKKVLAGENISINEKLGKIIRTMWNEKDQAIDFVAEFYDLSTAWKIMGGLIKFISVGFGRGYSFLDGKKSFVNVIPREASLVYDPRDQKAMFKPVLR